MGSADVHSARTIIEGAGASVRAIDELIAKHEVARPDVRLKAAGCGRSKNPRHAKRSHRPDIGAIVDRMRWVLVLAAMSGQKGHRHIADSAHGNLAAWLAEWSFDRQLFDCC